MAEAVVVVDDIGHYLVGVVSIDIVAPPPLVQEYFGAIEAPYFAVSARGVGQRECRNRLADHADGIGKVLNLVGMADQQLHAIVQTHGVCIDMALLQFRGKGQEFYAYRYPTPVRRGGYSVVC